MTLIVLGLVLFGFAIGMIVGGAVGHHDGYVAGKRDQLRYVLLQIDEIVWKDDSRGGLL